MGVLVSSNAKKKVLNANEEQQKEDEIKNLAQKKYDENCLDAANLAIAIQTEDFRQNIELRFSCDNLPKLDAFSNSDPMVAVYHMVDNVYKLYGYTECIPDCANPKFTRSFIFSNNPERSEKIKLEIFDVDDFENWQRLWNHDLIGYVELDINQVLNNPVPRTIIHPKRKRNGTITVRCREHEVDGKKFHFQIAAKDFISKYEIWLRLSIMGDNKEFNPIYSTTCLKNHKRALVLWEEFTLFLAQLGNDEKNYIKLEVLEQKDIESKSLVLGEVEITIMNLKDKIGGYIKVMNNSLQVGQIKLIKLDEDDKPSFVKYLTQTAEVSIIACIDFTKSNGTIDNPDSLHYSKYKNSEDSPYGVALKEVVGVLQYFDADNVIPLYGFGGKLPPYYNCVSHCFAVNGRYYDPDIGGGADSILKVYRESLNSYRLHGPTIFSEIVRLGCEYAEDSECDSQQVEQLNKFIETDPEMEKSIRPIIHFFIYKNHNDDTQSLARECMKYLPQQFLKYMEMNNIQPSSQKKAKAAVNEYMKMKIEHKKKQKKNKDVVQRGIASPWIVKQKEQFIKCLMNLGYDKELVILIVDKEGICCPDISYFIEIIKVINEEKKKQKSISKNANKLKQDIKNIENRLPVPKLIKEQLKDRLVYKQQYSESTQVGFQVVKVRQVNEIDNLVAEMKQKKTEKQKEFIKNIQDVTTFEKEYQKDKIKKPIPNQMKTSETLSETGMQEDYVISSNSLMAGGRYKSQEISVVSSHNKSINMDPCQNQSIEQISFDNIYKIDTLSDFEVTQNLNVKKFIYSSRLKKYRKHEEECVVCKQRIINIILIPCSHASCCKVCFDNNSTKGKCPTCNIFAASYILTKTVEENDKEKIQIKKEKEKEKIRLMKQKIIEEKRKLPKLVVDLNQQ